MNAWIGTLLLSCAYLALLLWALRNPAARGPGWRDLRWWITALVAIQLGLYWYF